MRRKLGHRQSGVILVVILVAVAAITGVVLTTSSSVGSSIKVAANYSKTIGTFNLAEVGIAKARQMIEGQDFDTILTNYAHDYYPDNRYLIPPTPYGEMGTYEVTVQNDANDIAGSPLNDTNGILKVVSVGRNRQGGRVTIQIHLQLISETTPIEFPPDPTCGAVTCDSAGIFCGVQSEIGVSGSAWSFDGADYTVPDYTCSGASCDTTSDPSTSSNFDAISEGTLISPAGISSDQNLGSVNSSCDQWQTFYNQWASVSSSAPGVVTISDNYSVSNDCSSPKVYLVNSTKPAVRLSGYFCGMFIIASNTALDMTGSTTLVGNILAMGNYSNISYSGLVGTTNFYGKLIFKSTTIDTQKELELKGDAGVRYSSQGEAFALQAINNANAGGGSSGSGSLITASWEEIY